MAETTASVAATSGETATTVSPTKNTKTSPPSLTKAQAKPAHPKYAEMVNAAIEELKERGGSSLQAIKKYINEKYKVDTDKQALFIKRYIKTAVSSGILIQTKGKGAAGSFKLPTANTAKAPSKSKSSKPKRTVKKVPTTKSAALQKPTSPKKAAAKKISKAVAEKKKVPKGPAAKPPKAKTTKATSTTKSPVKKTKPTASPKKTKPAAPKKKKAAPKRTAATTKQ